MVTLHRLNESDRPTLRQFWIDHWGDDLMVIRGQVYTTDGLEGFVAVEDNAWVGLATFLVEGDACEITSLDSLREGRGIGASLIEAVKAEALARGCARLRLITTNDNTHALRFYQRRGFVLTALYPRAIEESRKLKPGIPLTGNDGIPIRDELELEMLLA